MPKSSENLCVDLDGTLIISDSLWELMLRALRHNPLFILLIPILKNKLLQWLIKQKVTELFSGAKFSAIQKEEILLSKRFFGERSWTYPHVCEKLIYQSMFPACFRNKYERIPWSSLRGKFMKNSSKCRWANHVRNNSKKIMLLNALLKVHIFIFSYMRNFKSRSSSGSHRWSF